MEIESGSCAPKSFNRMAMFCELLIYLFCDDLDSVMVYPWGSKCGSLAAIV